MKVLSKKRQHQMTRILSVNIEANMLKYQVLWYASFIVVYVWFLYWVCYDFFVWHKPFSEVNLVNYVGSIAAIAFIWAGTKLWKRDHSKVGSPKQKLLPQKPPQQKRQPKATAITTATATPANSTCTHYLGYLNKRQQQQEIPAECLTCEKLIQCMSSTN